MQLVATLWKYSASSISFTWEILYCKYFSQQNWESHVRSTYSGFYIIYNIQKTITWCFLSRVLTLMISLPWSSELSWVSTSSIILSSSSLRRANETACMYINIHLTCTYINRQFTCTYINNYIHQLCTRYNCHNIDLRDTYVVHSVRLKMNTTTFKSSKNKQFNS